MRRILQKVAKTVSRARSEQGEIRPGQTVQVSLSKLLIKAALFYELDNYLPDLVVDEVLVTDVHGRLDQDFDNRGPELVKESQMISRGHIASKNREDDEVYRRSLRQNMNSLLRPALEQDVVDDAGYESAGSEVSLEHCRRSPYYPPCGEDCWLREKLVKQIEKTINISVADDLLASVPPGVYRPLDPNFMRLLILQPGSTENPVVCELSHQPVPHTIPGEGPDPDIIYEALSYTWGDPKPTHVITCNGKSFPVGTNLFHALVHLRLPERPRMLWIDAISINQNDIAERNGQISHMYNIYQSAKRVVVWLGLHHEDSELAMEGTQYLRHAENRQAITRHDHGPECIHKLERLTLSLEALFQRPWFTRSWVRQEVAAAKAVIVKCGFDEVSWTSLKKANNCRERLREKFFSNLPSSPYNGPLKSKPLSRKNVTLSFLKRNPLVGQSLLSENADLRSLWYYHAGGLLEHLMVSRAFDATDPRDKVYAVLGMTREPIENDQLLESGLVDAGVAKMRVDYSSSISEVYQYAAKYIINRDKNLDVLCILSTHRDENSKDLPSWTPDWRVPVSKVPLYKNWEYFGYKFGAAGFIKTTLQDQCDMGRLIVEGFEYCKVTELMPLGAVSIPHPPEQPAGSAEAFDPAVHLRRIAMTDRCPAILPSSAVVGDSVWILFGCKMPIVLRMVREEERVLYEVVGPCYLTTAMWGKALREFEEEGSQPQRVVLV